MHVVTGLKNTPAPSYDLFKTDLLVVGTTISIPLMRGAEPLFSAANDPSDGMFFDAISIRLEEEAIVALAEFGSYDGNKFVTPSVGAAVTIEGYPCMGLERIPLSRGTGKVMQVVGASTALSISGRPGYSGGPAITSEGVVGVTYGDIGESPALTNALINNFSVLRHVLFR